MDNKKIIGIAIAAVALIIIVFLILRGDKEDKTEESTTEEKGIEAQPAPAPVTPAVPDSPAFCTGKFKDVRYRTYRDVSDWGDYATNIKTHITNSDHKDVEAYNAVVDEVTAFFKAYDITPTGAHVVKFKDEIKAFVDENFGTVPANWEVGELRCDKFV